MKKVQMVVLAALIAGCVPAAASAAPHHFAGHYGGHTHFSGSRFGRGGHFAGRGFGGYRGYRGGRGYAYGGLDYDDSYCVPEVRWHRRHPLRIIRSIIDGGLLGCF